jgi:cytoskeletal protein CcmA (bactofilin family)
MITALLVSMIVLSIALVAVGLSIHSSTSSDYDRKRTEAIDAAEAGLNSFYSQLTTTPAASMPCPVTSGQPNESVDLPSSSFEHYDLFLSFFNEWPPASQSDLTCAQVQAGTDPTAALVTSVGTAGVAQTQTQVVRTMESVVHLTPIYGGFNKAVFSNQQLNFQNKFTINGYTGNDGDVYTNGDFTLNNNTLIKGSVYAQGAATIGQGVINANVWANNAVSLSSGIQVLGDVTSSTSSITLSNNSSITGNAKAGTSVSGGTIGGTMTQNSPSGPPPQLSLPKYCWPGCDAQGNPNTATMDAFVADGYTVRMYSDCTSALSDIKNWFGQTGGDYVVVITSSDPCGGGIAIGGNQTFNLRGNLAIFLTAGDTTGKTNFFSTNNNVSFYGAGGKWNLYLVRSWVPGITSTCKFLQPNISVSNSTSFNNLVLFVYSPCRIDFGNNNAGGVDGMIIGGQVNITNQMVMNYVPIIAPAFNIVGYQAAISYEREVANGT